MLHAAYTAEVVDRLGFNSLLGQATDNFRTSKGKQYQYSMGSYRKEVIRSILDLVGARFFVFLDQTGFVLIKRTACYNTGLRMALCRDPINRKRRPIFGKENTLSNELLQILPRSLENLTRVGHFAIRKLRFRSC